MCILITEKRLFMKIFAILCSSNTKKSEAVVIWKCLYINNRLKVLIDENNYIS